MEVLVTGGSGFVGHYLVRALRERSDNVRVLALPEEDASWLKELGVRVYRGNICEPETLNEPMQGVDRVFHLAALMGVWRPMSDYYAVNVAGTENVCRAALKAGVRRLVHLSSWTVYGMNLDRPATEDQGLQPLKEPYAMTKAEGDKLVRGLIAEEGLPAVVIRPGTIFGPGDRLNFGRIADRMRAGTWITIGSGQNALPFVYVTDVVHGLLLACDEKCAIGQAYNITNDRPLTQQETWQAIAEVLGVRPPRIRVPLAALFAASFAAELIANVIRAREPIVTRHGVMLFGGNNLLSIEKARRELGYEPQMPLRDGIRLAAEWYRRQGSSQ